jgi:hypothetical protein
MRSVSSRDEEWRRLYRDIRSVLAKFGTEDAYGEADYWVVDDDYGDTMQKVCVHRESILSPVLIKSLQAALMTFPVWRVMLQMEFPISGVPYASSGVIVHRDGVEEHWDKRLTHDIATRLGL